jgi:4-amino-4-deoxy-L-arabinose transferase-like glycosyltransferase
MPVSTSFRASPVSDRPARGAGPALALALAATALSAAATWFCLARGYTLYYGDAQAHLGIARRLADSRTPGYDQIGTVWLPLPHLLMAPAAAHDAWWRTGLAGALPNAAAFVLAVLFLYLGVSALTETRWAGLTAAALFALNPNVLYLQSIPMTEMLFAACLTGTWCGCVLFGRRPSLWYAAAAGLAALAGTLTRYEGWFVLPFAALYFLLAGGGGRWRAGLLFAGIAGLGPLYWLAHNAYYFGDWLEFYRGPYSAKAIQGAADYPGHHDWRQAWRQYASAVRGCAGGPLLALAAAGLALHLAAPRRWVRSVGPLALLAAVPAFYLWSVHSGGTPVFVPDRWPHSYYNTRYGIAAIPLLAVAAALGVARLPGRWRAGLCGFMALAGAGPWLLQPSPEAWITWKESQVNSEARRAWTAEAAAWLHGHYRAGTGIFTTFGDVTGVFREAGIPLRETLTWDHQPYWQAAIHRPDLFLREEWAVAFAGDPVHVCLRKAWPTGPRYTLRKRITIPNAPALEIYRRDRAPAFLGVPSEAVSELRAWP